MQATVKSFDGTTDSGTVLLDDGTELAFEAGAFTRSGLRLLRAGQRVRLLVTSVGAEHRIDAITIATMPWRG